MFYPHVSVDCVLLGTNEDKLCVLLVERQVAGSNEKHYKLPGSLIYESEDLDTAAYRVLNEATGLKRAMCMSALDRRSSCFFWYDSRRLRRFLIIKC